MNSSTTTTGTEPRTNGVAAPDPSGAAPAPNAASTPVETDRVFAEPAKRVDDFKFDARTAKVFDDMLGRSVPFYAEMQRMTSELAADFAVPGTNLYDLGCSTGTTLAAIDEVVDPSVRFVGMDYSAEMLEKARLKLSDTAARRPVDLVQCDLHELKEIENASVVILTLTLQFVRPLHRERLVRAIAAGTNEQGCLILIEKLTESDTLFNRLFIKYYYDMKRRHGYSDLEISQKREALENVLIPYRPEENEKLLLEAGYRRVQPFFRWYNFAGMIAVK
jgi:tRNA (cmo5U34)-methyltransferase